MNLYVPINGADLTQCDKENKRRADERRLDL